MRLVANHFCSLLLSAIRKLHLFSRADGDSAPALAPGSLNAVVAHTLNDMVVHDAYLPELLQRYPAVRSLTVVGGCFTSL
jgi:hypothetical protein